MLDLINIFWPLFRTLYSQDEHHKTFSLSYERTKLCLQNTEPDLGVDLSEDNSLWKCLYKISGWVVIKTTCSGSILCGKSNWDINLFLFLSFVCLFYEYFIPHVSWGREVLKTWKVKYREKYKCRISSKYGTGCQDQFLERCLI